MSSTNRRGNNDRGQGLAADSRIDVEAGVPATSGTAAAAASAAATDATAADATAATANVVIAGGATADVSLVAASSKLGNIQTTVPTQSSPRWTERGVRVVFKNLTYTVRSNSSRRLFVDLLKSASGVIPAASLTALMGPSGSSKTTLLDVLSGRTTAGKIARGGCVTYGGARPSPAFLRHSCAYVEQRESLVSNLTVFEMLMYTAELRLSAKATTLDERRRRVDAVLSRLRLRSCAHVRIGSAMDKGVSGGQAKRVNIGVALVGDPRVLFLDEPTTGLDAIHANEVMSAVKALTRGDDFGDDDEDDDFDADVDADNESKENNKRRRRQQRAITVCATIHSPTPYAYSLFDSLVLLIAGRVVYCGPTRDASPIRFFQEALSTMVLVPEGGGRGGGGDGRDGEGGLSRRASFELPRFDFAAAGCDSASSSSSSSQQQEQQQQQEGNSSRKQNKNLPSLSAPEWLLEVVVAADRRPGAGEALAAAFARSKGARAVDEAAEEDGCFSRPGSPSSSAAAPPSSASTVAFRSSSSRRSLSSSSSSSGRVVASPTGAQAAAHGVSSALEALCHRARGFFFPFRCFGRRRDDGSGEQDHHHASSSSSSLSPFVPQPNSRLSTTMTLLRYRMTRDLVDPSWLGPRSLDKLVLTPIIASLYWRVGAKDNASNTSALLFLFSILPGYAVSSYMPCIVLERPLFVREIADGLYTPISYLAAKMIGESVVYVFVSIAVTCMVWWACALDTRGEYLAFWAGNLITTVSGVALGYAIAALSPSMGVANAALPAFVTLLLFFVGMLLRPVDIPKYWKWIEPLSFLKYSWRAQMINVFGAGSQRPEPEVMAYYGLAGDENGDNAPTAWGQLGIGVGFAAGFVFVAWASLAFVRHQRR